MTFVERAIERAGLWPIFEARAKGDFDTVRTLLKSDTDILVLGAIADRIRAQENGVEVRVHPSASADVVWIRKATGTELDLLRSCAIARITSPARTKIGVDWAEHGLELAQVALGFGATDLTGPITKKSGTLITAEDLKKVKGEGMVQQSALKRKEIAALIHNAGRECVLTDEETKLPSTTMEATAHV